MKSFIDDNFLLETEYARELHHNYAKQQPIIDYHCHLPPAEIAQNRQFENMTQLWIDGDHYKWRAMRNLGISEDFITGKATDKEKFEKWAYTIPYALRNPLYHWTHMELQRYFGIQEVFNPENSDAVYKHCNHLLQQPEFSTQGLIKQQNVEVICTTDDPLDDLSYHQKLRNSDFSTQVLPTFRPDGILGIEKDDFVEYMETLSTISGVSIKDLETLKEATKARIDFFHSKGCRLSDHGLPHAYASQFTSKQVDDILKRRLAKGNITKTEEHQFKSAMMFYLGCFYASKGWTMQLHLGPIRDNNTKVLKEIGINAGIDSIGDFAQAENLASFLDTLNTEEGLPKTIIYNSNPNDNEVFATMAGNFSEVKIKGKVQFGAAWWFLDQKSGIINQLNALSNMGLISCTIGMLTDSRSFLSFPRHEYFRRILCNLFGNDIARGELPNDIKWIGKMISDICYQNAKDYFQFPEHKPAEITQFAK